MRPSSHSRHAPGRPRAHCPRHAADPPYNPATLTGEPPMFRMTLSAILAASLLVPVAGAETLLV